VATVVTETVKDALERGILAFSGPGTVTGRGLRGGTVRFEFRGHFGMNWRIVLHGVRFSDDVTVDGIVHWRPNRSLVSADLSVAGPSTADGRLEISTSHYLKTRYFHVTGGLGGQAVDVQVPQT
jgi:hypothetical protein